jgi:putative oxidoreductase
VNDDKRSTSIDHGTTGSTAVEERGLRAPDAPSDQEGRAVALLLLRLILAATMGAHGLIKVFGFLGGPGLGSFSQALQGFGFTRGITLLAWVTGLTEVGSAVLLVVGLFTPLAAAGMLGIQLSLIWAKSGGGFFEGKGGGFEFELTLGVIALALLLAGPGRLALDAGTRWGRRPLPFGLAGLLVAVLAAIVINAAF